MYAYGAIHVEHKFVIDMCYSAKAMINYRCVGGKNRSILERKKRQLQYIRKIITTKKQIFLSSIIINIVMHQTHHKHQNSSVSSQ